MTDFATTHLLGKYHGFGLFYDEVQDIFYSDLQEQYELKNEPKRCSLKDLRNVIDQTIKANLNFQPFEAYYASIGWGEEDEKKRIAQEQPRIVKILAVKKDGGFMLKKEKDSYGGSQINGKDRLKLFVKDEASEKLGAEIAIIEAEIDLLARKKTQIYKKYKPLDLSFINDYTK